MYKLVWNHEVIEEDIEDYETAQVLQGEYTMAYGGYVEIVRQ